MSRTGEAVSTVMYFKGCHKFLDIFPRHGVQHYAQDNTYKYSLVYHDIP